MLNKGLAAFALVCLWLTGQAQTPGPFDAATAFGARPTASNLHLSPDGMSVAYIGPAKGQGSVAYTLSLAKGSSPKAAFGADDPRSQCRCADGHLHGLDHSGIEQVVCGPD